MRIAPAGDRARLVTFDRGISAAELHAHANEWRARDDVLAVVPGHSSLLVVSGRRQATDEVRSTFTRHRITVSFAPVHGPDLAELLARIGISRDDFLSRVESLTLTARFLGFRAGFAYLDGWPEEWSMPRRPTSRPLVPHGTFAIAGAMSAFYPIDSPGGWNLLGRTAMLPRIAAGDEITIVPTLEVLDIPPQPRPRPPLEVEGVEIVSAPLATVVTAEDWSRVARGESPGGPFDDIAAAMANRAAGNEPGAPLLECAMTGPRVRARRRIVAAWCGPDRDVKMFRLAAGEELPVGRVEQGLRGYLAVGPGGDVPRGASAEDRFTIRAQRGPHDADLPPFIDCEVTPRLDRVGIRLRPLEALNITAPADLPSCGMLCGTVQLHPDGSLVAMGPDHPVTGGYSQPMTVLSTERWKLAQLGPGERVRFAIYSTT